MTNTCVEIKRSRPLLGTFVEITVEGDDRDVLMEAMDDAFSAIAWVQQLMNVHDPESELSYINRMAHMEAVRVSQWTYEVLRKAQELSARTHGEFDVTKGLHVDYRAIELSNNRCVRLLDPTATIDLSGIAKGFAVDRACDVLKRPGVRSALVNAGGDLRALGERVFQIYVRHAGFPSVCFMTIPLQNASLCNSARYFGASFRARDQKLPEEILACGVRTADCVSADALTKVVMTGGENASDLLEDYAAEAYLVKQGVKDRFHLWCYGKPWL